MSKTMSRMTFRMTLRTTSTYARHLRMQRSWHTRTGHSRPDSVSEKPGKANKECFCINKKIFFPGKTTKNVFWSPVSFYSHFDLYCTSSALTRPRSGRRHGVHAGGQARERHAPVSSICRHFSSVRSEPLKPKLIGEHAPRSTPPTCPLEIRAEFEALANAALRVRREGLLDVLHLDAPRRVGALPEEPVDEHLRNRRCSWRPSLCRRRPRQNESERVRKKGANLEKVADKVVCPLGVGAWNLEQRQLLPHRVDGFDLPDVIAVME